MPVNGENIRSGLKRKNLTSYHELFFRYHGRLVLFARKFTGDLQEAQDLVQDAFLKLWENPALLDTVKSPKAYLFQAVRNSCRNHHRHLQIMHTAEEELTSRIDAFEKEAYFNHDDPLRSLLEMEMEEQIEEIIGTMPEKCRQVYRMSRHDHLKNAEIALELGISVKMVEKHISKALAILRSRLSDYLGFILFLFFKKS